MPEDLARIGEYYLARVKQSKNIYICWYDTATKQRRSVSTGTGDLRQAETALAEHVLRVHRPTDAKPDDVTIAEVLLWYWEEHASTNEDAETANRAGAVWLEFWGQDTVADIVFAKVDAFKNWMRKDKGLAWSTVSRYLANGRAALNHAHIRNRIASVPRIKDVPASLIEATAQQPYAMSISEMAKMFDNIKSDHVWNVALMMLGTICRPENTLDFRLSQVDWEIGRIKLNPDGREQTKKFRPIVRLTPFLRPWMMAHRRSCGDDALWVQYHGHEVESLKTATRALRKSCGFPTRWTIKSIRHSMTTMLGAKGVNPWEMSVQLGHAVVDGGRKTTMRYFHLSPEYLVGIEPLIEGIVSEIDAKMEKRSLYLKPHNVAAPINMGLKRSNLAG